MDETIRPVLAPGTGAVRQDWLWVVLRDQRGWGGDDPSHRAIVEALRSWIEGYLQDLSSANELARHIKYALKRWDGMTRFLEDGRLEMDTNGAENAIRRFRSKERMRYLPAPSMGRKLAARIASLIGTCRKSG